MGGSSNNQSTPTAVKVLYSYQDAKAKDAQVIKNITKEAKVWVNVVTGATIFFNQ